MTRQASPYSQLFTVPGAKSFSISAALARLPMSMISLGIVLAIQHIYGDWTSAGTLSAVYVMSAAVATPVFARLFDRHGQRVVGKVALPLSIATLAVFAFAVLFRFPLWSLYIFGVLMGLTQFSFGALVRTRWTWVLRRNVTDEETARRNSKLLSTAYAFESAIDELIYVIGPVFATFLATTVHPVSQLFVPLGAMVAGGTVFFVLRSAAAPPITVEVVDVEAVPSQVFAPAVEQESVDEEERRLARKHSRRSPISMMRTMKTRTALGFPGMVLLILSFTVFSMSFSAYDVSLVAMTEAQGREYIVGIVMATFAGGSMVGALIYGSRQWRGSLWLRYALCLTVLTLGFFAFTFVRGNLVALCVVQFITGLFVSPTFATCNMIIEDSVAGVYLTEGLSWLSTSSAVGSSIGSTAAGILIDQDGVSAGFSIPWMAVLATLIIVVVFKSGLLSSILKGKARSTV